MTGHNPILKTEQAQKWLSQFAMGDHPLAEELLGAFLLVSRDDFNDHLRELILARAEEVDGVVALYAERELRHRKGVPHRLFKESTRKPLRAQGSAGPPAVKATKAYDPSVGSEGIVAKLITDLCREFPKKFANQPGPEQIRKRKVRAFWVVTDLVGTGTRALNYLRAAWRVRSVRSWWSGRFLRFGVIAYASTERGLKLVSNAHCRPDVFHVMPCPTIATAFAPHKAEQMVRLCQAYYPTYDEPGIAPWARGGPSLGYDGTGALLVFAHGAPNNVPLMFHKASKGKRWWAPLFPSRVSAGIDSRSFGVSLTAAKIQKRLANLGQAALAKPVEAQNTPLSTWEVLMFLGALSRPPRLKDDVLSRRTGMKQYVVGRLCTLMTGYGWIDSQRRLTDAGQGQLHHARKKFEEQGQKILLPVRPVRQMPYYPKSLRYPV